MTEHIQATPVNASTVLGVLVDGDTTLTANTDFITVTTLATVTLPDAALPGKAIRIVADGADATLNATPHLIFNADAGSATFVVPDGSAVDIVRSTSLDWFIASGGGGTGGLSDLVPLNVNRIVASAGVALLASRADHKHDIDVAVPVSVGTANAAGTSISLARSDHVHAGVALSAVAPVNVTKAAAVVGVATAAARADHKHDISTAVPVSVGVSNAEGTATTLARSDHVHAAGSGSLGDSDSARVTTDVAFTLAAFTSVMAVTVTNAPGERIRAQVAVNYEAETITTNALVRWRLVDSFVAATVAAGSLMCTAASTLAFQTRFSLALLFESAPRGLAAATTYTLEISVAGASTVNIFAATAPDEYSACMTVDCLP